MSQRDDDNLPEKMRRDLHELISSGPEQQRERQAEFLGRAHRQVERGWGWAGAAGRIAVAATVLIAAGLAWQVQQTPVEHARFAAAEIPTIVDALLLAKRPGVSQAQIDRIAMAAVQLKPEVVQ